MDKVPHPGEPGPGEVLLRVGVTGICGSDLHTYEDARIGDTPVKSPLVLGHEFAGIVEEVGRDALDGSGMVIRPGARVAVDPAKPCYRCESCERGHPNLCSALHFCGTYPDDGSLCEWMNMPARSCHPLPDSLDDEEGAMLEPLGVALHAIDLAHIRVGHSAVILGAGPIGLLTLQVARLAGAHPAYVIDPLPWRLKLAEACGGIPIPPTGGDAVADVIRQTNGRGVDVVIEAAWGDASVAQAAEMAKLGGRVVLVGIPRDDRLTLKHSTARRKGLTMMFCRRMKHVYPRAITLATERRVDLKRLVTHRFALADAPTAFRVCAKYQDAVVKVMVHHRT